MSLIFIKLQEFNLGLQGLLSGNYKKIITVTCEL